MREVPGQRDVGEGVQLQSDTHKTTGQATQRGPRDVSSLARSPAGHSQPRERMKLTWPGAEGGGGDGTVQEGTTRASPNVTKAATNCTGRHVSCPPPPRTYSPQPSHSTVCKVQLNASPGAIERGMLPRRWGQRAYTARVIAPLHKRPQPDLQPPA